MDHRDQQQQQHYNDLFYVLGLLPRIYFSNGAGKAENKSVLIRYNLELKVQTILENYFFKEYLFFFEKIVILSKVSLIESLENVHLLLV